MLSNGSFANPKWTELSLGDLMFFHAVVEEKIHSLDLINGNTGFLGDHFFKCLAGIAHTV